MTSPISKTIYKSTFAVARAVASIIDKYDLPEEEAYQLFGAEYTKYLNEYEYDTE